MAEVDDLILINLKGLGSEYLHSLESLDALTDSDAFVQATAELVSIITGDRSFTQRVESISAKYRVITSLTNKLKDLGFTSEIGLNSFLHPDSRSVRGILTFLLETIPKAAQPEAEVEDLSEGHFSRKVKQSMKAWLRKSWQPPFDPVLKVEFREIVPLAQEQDLPEHLQATWAEYKAARPSIKQRVAKASPLALLSTEAQIAQLAQLSFNLSQDIGFGSKAVPVSIKRVDTRQLPSLHEVLTRQQGNTTEDLSSLFALEAEFNQAQDLLESQSSAESAIQELEEKLRIAIEEAYQVEALVTSAQAQLTKYTTDIKILKEENERLRKELERKHRLAKALSEGSPEALRKEIQDLETRMTELRREWEANKTPMMQEARAQQTKVDKIKEKYSDKIEEIKMMKEEIKEMVEEAEYKDELHDILLEEEAKGTSTVNRNLFIHKIGDIVGRLKSQRKELAKNTKDVTQMQVSVDLTKDSLARVERATEASMDAEAVRNKKAKPIQEQLASIRQQYRLLIRAVDEQLKVVETIGELRVKYDAAYTRTATRDIKQLQKDLETLRAEAK